MKSWRPWPSKKRQEAKTAKHAKKDWRVNARHPRRLCEMIPREFPFNQRNHLGQSETVAPRNHQTTPSTTASRAGQTTAPTRRAYHQATQPGAISIGPQSRTWVIRQEPVGHHDRKVMRCNSSRAISRRSKINISTETTPAIVSSHAQTRRRVEIAQANRNLLTRIWPPFNGHLDNRQKRLPYPLTCSPSPNCL